MSPVTQICSRCKSVVTAVESPTGGRSCPRCQAALGPPPSRSAQSMAPPVQPASLSQTPLPGPLQPARPLSPAVAAASPLQPAGRPTPSAGPRPVTIALGAAAAVMLLLVFVGVGAAVLLGRGGSRKTAGGSEVPPAKQPEEPSVAAPAKGGEDRFDPRLGMPDDLKGADGKRAIDVPKPPEGKHGMARPDEKPGVPPKQGDTTAPTPATTQSALSLLPLEVKGGVMADLSPSLLKRRVSAIKIEARAPRLAVLKGAYDNIGSILDRLGPGYKYDNITPNHFLQLKTLTPYNVIFLNCGAPMPFNPRVRENLRHYVDQGGTLYASDLQYTTLQMMFHEYAPRPTAFAMGGYRQLNGDLTATVLDPGLRRILGKTLDVRFDMVHMPALFDKQKSQIYLSVPGGPNGFGGMSNETPLLAKFRPNKGQVIFTSYHNSRNINDKTLKLLLHIVFSAVNNEVDRAMRQATLEGGFKQTEANNLNLSRGDTLARQEVMRSNNGTLRFGVGFRGGSAQLRLRVFAPDGKVIEHSGAESFVLEIDDAPAGRWHYSVTAVEAPHDHFPFTLIIAER